ncbi:MAG: HEPN domain-containing protein [Terracidiphilus sp.]|jgi:HEPN domain-containing protein
MNRNDFKEIAELRLRESKALLAAGLPEGAYYLAGYAVECALKACIAKRTREHDFPDKKLVNDSHTHNLKSLLQLAELKTELDIAIGADPTMESVLDKILEWSETCRYQRKTAQEATALLTAIEDQAGGLLPWIRLHW